MNIEKATTENTDYRRVLYTGKNSQLVLMSLSPNEEIGEEVHALDQFIRIETGTGKAILDSVEHIIKENDAIVIPEGMRHNIINTSEVVMKLYTVYSPPEHRDGIRFATKEESLKVEEHFDGKTTE